MIDDGENCYSFDHIFGKFTSQEYLYNKIINRHIHDFMKGRNSTIFAYGQTGSGKTHTMFGDLRDPLQFGIIPRTLY
jgi:kinesin family member 5